MTDTALRKSLTAPENAVDLAQHIIEFDPAPAGYVFAATPLERRGGGSRQTACA